MAKTIVGLEITEEGIRAAELTTGSRPTLVASGSVPVPPGAAKDSEVFDADAVALALRQLWSRAGFRSRRVVLGLASRRILVREFTTHAMRPDLLRQALPFQVQDLLPVPLDQAVLDFYPASQQGEHVTGLLVAAVAETVEDLIAAVSKAKLTVDVVDLAPFGLARAASRVCAPEETIAAFHLGDHTSYVIVMEAGVPRFVRVIPVDILTGAVRARELAALAERAEEQQSAVEALETVPPSDGPPSRRTRSVARAPRPAAMPEAAVANLAARLRGTLSFYAERSAKSISRVLLSGAGAAAAGVSEALAAGLPTPVEYLDAQRVVSGRRMPQGEDALNLVATVGLAMGGVR